ncbi:MAG TPA: hypothetical protein VGP62_08430 [Bryobacteraceae bacterium]|jgi:hypothetical protein|nr:hypothetical protein [Bryobacteraceae bacterium]
MALLSANVIVCEAVLFEKTDVPTAVRIMTAIRLAGGTKSAHFFVVTFLNSQPGDFAKHVLKIQVLDKSGPFISQADDYPFVYGYKLDSSGPGGFTLTTEFNIDTTSMPSPAGWIIVAFLDGQAVARIPLMLLRR